MNISLAHSLTVVWMILKVMANLWASTFAGRSWYGERDVKVLLGGGVEIMSSHQSHMEISP